MRTRIGLIGCGNIAKAYIPNLQRFLHLELTACADLNEAAASERAAEFGIPRVLSPEALTADPEIDLVVNLTIPKAHAAIDIACLRSGKHVFSEKPFALSRDEALGICRVAEETGRRVGCAPDTVLGAGIQTCRSLLDAGKIGRPIAFTANMLCGGHEHWHPSPEFYYEKGGGPLFDMGPYYLTALITLLGPVASVAANAVTSFAERTITSEPKRGKVMRVEVPTHVTALLEFACGATGTLTMSFDLRGRHSQPLIEIYGDEASLRVPDPNAFGGEVAFSRGRNDWEIQPLAHPYAAQCRGLGAADLAAAVRNGRDHRANERVALHCMDIMQTIHEAASAGQRLQLSTTCERPLPMDASAPEWDLS